MSMIVNQALIVSWKIRIVQVSTWRITTKMKVSVVLSFFWCELPQFVFMKVNPAYHHLTDLSSRSSTTVHFCRHKWNFLPILSKMIEKQLAIFEDFRQNATISFNRDWIKHLPPKARKFGNTDHDSWKPMLLHLNRKASTGVCFTMLPRKFIKCIELMISLWYNFHHYLFNLSYSIIFD